MALTEELRSRKSYMTTAETMALLRKTRNTVCEWVRVGKLPAIRIGNEYLFDPRTLADWLSGRKTSDASANTPAA